jgi:hypothetical protein
MKEEKTISDILASIPPIHFQDIHNKPNMLTLYGELKRGNVAAALKTFHFHMDRRDLFLTAYEIRKARRKRDNRARKIKYGSNWDSVVRKVKPILYEDQNAQCNICHKLKDISKLTVDHIIALRYGGENKIENMQLLCPECHVEKDRQTAEEGRIGSLYESNKEMKYIEKFLKKV